MFGFLNSLNIILVMNYLPRLIDSSLNHWMHSDYHKPLLVRGARQVGKSWAIRHLGKSFKFFIEINFEKNPEYKEIFSPNLDVGRIISQLSLLTHIPVIDGETLIFLDEIQECREAIMSLRFFKEDRPGLHVVGAGSLLELTLAEIPTFGVGRIHSLFMYPMTFDEFLIANGEDELIKIRNLATPSHPLPDLFHNRLIDLFRTYIIVGGMPEVVDRWISTHDYLQCQELLNDIIVSYEDDFAKYRNKVNPQLLRSVFRSAASQITKKFTYSDVGGNYKTYEVKRALNLLILAGLLLPVVRTAANGLPLGCEADNSFCKVLVLDPGLTLRLLYLSLGGDVSHINLQILTSSVSELVNKGPMSELIAGLELNRYRSPDVRHELFYWIRQEKNSLAEVDYVTSSKGKVLPIEIKAGVQGGMKSLWIFMREKHLKEGVRSSLENFGSFEFTDKKADNATRQVLICPLYAISQLERLLSSQTSENQELNFSD